MNQYKYKTFYLQSGFSVPRVVERSERSKRSVGSATVMVALVSDIVEIDNTCLGVLSKALGIKTFSDTRYAPCSISYSVLCISPTSNINLPLPLT